MGNDRTTGPGTKSGAPEKTAIGHFTEAPYLSLLSTKLHLFIPVVEADLQTVQQQSFSHVKAMRQGRSAALKQAGIRLSNRETHRNFDTAVS
jgi:hypothetical protein